MFEDVDHPVEVYSKGRSIFRQGDVPDAMYILLEGKLAVIRDEVRIAVLSDPGTFIGEMSLLLGNRRNAEARAETDIRVLVVKDLSRFFRADPLRALEVARTLAQRLQEMDEKFLELRRLYKDIGGALADDANPWPTELEPVRRYLRAWRISL